MWVYIRLLLELLVCGMGLYGLLWLVMRKVKYVAGMIVCVLVGLTLFTGAFGLLGVDFSVSPAHEGEAISTLWSNVCSRWTRLAQARAASWESSGLVRAMHWVPVVAAVLVVIWAIVANSHWRYTRGAFRFFCLRILAFAFGVAVIAALALLCVMIAWFVLNFDAIVSADEMQVTLSWIIGGSVLVFLVIGWILYGWEAFAILKGWKSE